MRQHQRAYTAIRTVEACEMLGNQKKRGLPGKYVSVNRSYCVHLSVTVFGFRQNPAGDGSSSQLGRHPPLLAQPLCAGIVTNARQAGVEFSLREVRIN
jgi:hypothetical protein